MEEESDSGMMEPKTEINRSAPIRTLIKPENIFQPFFLICNGIKEIFCVFSIYSSTYDHHNLEKRLIKDW
jgi:hypothetical protein